MTSERLDILCLCTMHGVGGAQSNAGRLTRAFRERGYTAKLGYLFEREPDYVDEVEDHFIVSLNPPRSGIELAKFFDACRRKVLRLRPRAALGFHPLANIVGALTTGWCGRFVSTQAWPIHEQRRETQAIESFLTRTPLVAANVAVSKFVEDSFSVRGSKYRLKTRVIYNAPTLLPDVLDDKEACRRFFGMPSDGNLMLGTLGRLHSQKNYELAIRAVVHSPQAMLYLAGSGPQEQMLRSLAAELGVAPRVHFLGLLRGADVTRFLRAIDVMLMTSLYEGHPLAMLEAMSAGVPVLAHDIAVLREAGGSAVRYEANDPEAWGRALSEFSSNDLRRMRDEGLVLSGAFSMDQMVDEYLYALGLEPVKGRTLGAPRASH